MEEHTPTRVLSFESPLFLSLLSSLNLNLFLVKKNIAQELPSIRRTPRGENIGIIGDCPGIGLFVSGVKTK